MREIAIVSYKRVPVSAGDYYDLEQIIATAITEWREVDEQTYWNLLNYQTKYDYCVILKPPKEKVDELIAKTTEDYIKMVEKNAKLDAKMKKERELKLKKRKQMSLKKKRDIFERLKAELGEV